VINLPHEEWGIMQRWVDAYTVHMEARAEAMADPSIKQRITAAVQELKKDRANATSDKEREEFDAAIVNQQHVLDQLGQFDIEAYRDISARWKQIRGDLLSSGWDMRQNVDFFRMSNGNLHVSQKTALQKKHIQIRAKLVGEAGLTEKDLGPGIIWHPATAAVAITFFKFVHDSQTSVTDPREYTRRTLEQQGITAENFDQHADKLAIQNPWKEHLIVPATTMPRIQLP
jgi:hypothetical protein